MRTLDRSLSWRYIIIVTARKNKLVNKKHDKKDAATWIVAMSGFIAAIAALVSAIATLLMALK
jgi:hypothetical protein